MSQNERTPQKVPNIPTEIAIACAVAAFVTVILVIVVVFTCPEWIRWVI